MPRRLLPLLLLLPTLCMSAEPLQIAVASSFRPTLDKILVNYRASTSNEALVSSGATGVLYAQIVNGAQFDLLLAADSWRPQRLIDEGYSKPDDVRTYALGKLILAGPAGSLVDATENDIVRLLRSNQSPLALANPATAPYGAATKEVLQQLGLWQATAQYRVTGQSAAQAFQFFASGNAAFAFVSLSQWYNWQDRGEASWWLVPQEQYRPLKHDAIVIGSSKQKAAARRFLDFLGNESSVELIRRDGYEVPSNS